jgi:hypothetical protein
MKTIIAAVLTAMLSTTVMAQSTLVKEKKFHSTSNSVWNDSTGERQVTTNYAVSSNWVRSLVLAQQACFGKGAPYCRVNGAWDKGCLFVVVGRNPHDEKKWAQAGYVEKTTDLTTTHGEKEAKAEILAACTERYGTCEEPKGGCIGEPEVAKLAN